MQAENKEKNRKGRHLDRHFIERKKNKIGLLRERSRKTRRRRSSRSRRRRRRDARERVAQERRRRNRRI